MHARLRLHLYVRDFAIIIVHGCAIIIVHDYAIIIVRDFAIIIDPIVYVLGLIVLALGLIVVVHYTLYFNLNYNQYFVDFIVLALTHC